MPLTTSDLLQIAIVTIFTNIVARYANRIIENLEKKAAQAKNKIKEHINHD